MSKTAKILIAVGVIAVIAYGVYRWYAAKQKEAKVITIAPIPEAVKQAS